MKKNILSFVFCLVMSPAFAGDDAELGISHAWVRASLPGQTVTSGFVTLSNPLDKPLELKEVRSKVAKTVELHSHKMANGQMQMRKIEHFSIPAKGEVKFSPGGNHIMLMGLEKPLKENDTVTVEMCFDELCSLIKMPVVSIMHEGVYKDQ